MENQIAPHQFKKHTKHFLFHNLLLFICYNFIYNRKYKAITLIMKIQTIVLTLIYVYLTKVMALIMLLLLILPQSET